MIGATACAVPPEVRDVLERLASGERSRHGPDYALLQEATAGPVAWADDAWQMILPLLRHQDNRVRSIAGQTLSRLAPSADAATVLGDLDALVAATHDERFVTARHVLASLWHVGLANQAIRARLLTRLVRRAQLAGKEKNAALVRYDILGVLRRLFEETGDEAVQAEALALIEAEPDEKNAKKMKALWRGG